MGGRLNLTTPGEVQGHRLLPPMVWRSSSLCVHMIGLPVLSSFTLLTTRGSFRACPTCSSCLPTRIVSALCFRRLGHPSYNASLQLVWYSSDFAVRLCLVFVMSARAAELLYWRTREQGVGWGCNVPCFHGWVNMPRSSPSGLLQVPLDTLIIRLCRILVRTIAFPSLS